MSTTTCTCKGVHIGMCIYVYTYMLMIASSYRGRGTVKCTANTCTLLIYSNSRGSLVIIMLSILIFSTSLIHVKFNDGHDFLDYSLVPCTCCFHCIHFTSFSFCIAWRIRAKRSQRDQILWSRLWPAQSVHRRRRRRRAAAGRRASRAAEEEPATDARIESKH